MAGVAVPPSGVMQREVAGGHVTWAERAERGLLGRAELLDERAPGAEPAPEGGFTGLGSSPRMPGSSLARSTDGLGTGMVAIRPAV